MKTKKQSKPIQYHKNVPQSIKDFMGETPYEYIRGYNTISWKDAIIVSCRIKHPETKIEIFRADHSTLESLKDAIDACLDSPNYVESWLEQDYDDFHYEVEMKVTLTPEQMKENQRELDIWEVENNKFKELKKIIEHEIKIDRQHTLNEQKLRLERELEKLNQQIKNGTKK